MKLKEQHLSLEELAASAARSAAPIFRRNGWKWQTSERESYIPDEARIAAVISRLLAHASNMDEGGSISTGRFTAHFDPGLDDCWETVEVTLDLGSYAVERHPLDTASPQPTKED